MKIQLGQYQHWKTKAIYHVLGTGRHTESLEQHVIYFKPGDPEPWLRPAAMFTETIYDPTLGMVPRFKYLGPSSYRFVVALVEFTAADDT